MDLVDLTRSLTPDNYKAVHSGTTGIKKLIKYTPSLVKRIPDYKKMDLFELRETLKDDFTQAMIAYAVKIDNRRDPIKKAYDSFLIMFKLYSSRNEISVHLFEYILISIRRWIDTRYLPKGQIFEHVNSSRASASTTWKTLNALCGFDASGKDEKRYMHDRIFMDYIKLLRGADGGE